MSFSQGIERIQRQSLQSKNYNLMTVIHSINPLIRSWTVYLSRTALRSVYVYSLYGNMLQVTVKTARPWKKKCAGVVQSRAATRSQISTRSRKSSGSCGNDIRMRIRTRLTFSFARPFVRLDCCHLHSIKLILSTIFYITWKYVRLPGCARVPSVSYYEVVSTYKVSYETCKLCGRSVSQIRHLNVD